MEQPAGDINRIGYRATKGVFDYKTELTCKYIVKSGGCASCPIRCYSEYDIPLLAEYDLPTKTSNPCAPAGTMPTSFYPEGMHDWVDEGDSKIIARVPTVDLTHEERNKMHNGFPVHLTFPGKVMYFFDPETEKNLLF